MSASEKVNAKEVDEGEHGIHSAWRVRRVIAVKGVGESDCSEGSEESKQGDHEQR